MRLSAIKEKVLQGALKRRPLFFYLIILATILIVIVIGEIVYFFYSGYNRQSASERRVIEGEVVEIKGTTFTLEGKEGRDSLDIDGKVNYCGQDRGLYECVVKESSAITLGQYIEADWLPVNREKGKSIGGHWTIFVWD